MANDFGLSFSPTSLDEARNNKTADPNAAPVQDAIRTLNLKVPHVVGAAPINASLLNGMGSQGIGLPGGMDLEMFLRRLFGGGGMPGAQTPMGPGSMPGGPSPSMGSFAPPAPNFVPGVGPGEPAPGSQGPFTPGGETNTPPPAPSFPSAPSGPLPPTKSLPDTRMPDSFGGSGY